MRVLTFAIELRRMSVLPKILLLIARLGGNVTYLAAVNGRVNVVLQTPESAAHRFAPQIRRVVDVIALTELRMSAAKPAQSETAAETARKFA